MLQCRRVQPTAWQGIHIAVHMNLIKITLTDPGAQDGTSSRKERVLHSYKYHACLTSKFRSIVDGIPVLMQAHAHCIDPIDAVTCSTFDNKRTSLRKTPNPGSPFVWLFVFLCIRGLWGSYNCARTKQSQKNLNRAAQAWNIIRVSPALINC